MPWSRNPASGTAGGYGLGNTLTGTVEVRFSGGGLADPAGALVSLGAGNVANNRLSGLGGDDTIFGYGGKDTIFGGTGGDILRVGGDDRLSGNAGADHFVYNSVAEISGDVITDFTPGSDKIDLDGNGTADFRLTLSGIHTLHDTDFIL